MAEVVVPEDLFHKILKRTVELDTTEIDLQSALTDAKLPASFPVTPK